MNLNRTSRPTYNEKPNALPPGTERAYPSTHVPRLTDAMRVVQTKTDYVRHLVFRAILHGDYVPGDKIPTERAMEVQTSMSRVTVRRAYAELQQAGILQRRQGRGTFIATTSRANGQTMREIALLGILRHPFALEFIEAMETSAKEEDALLILSITKHDPVIEEATAIDLVGKGIRNLVVWPSGSMFASDTFRRLRILGTNMVFFDRMLPGPYADYVGLDNTHAILTLIEAALRKGKKHFIFISHDGLNADSDHQREEAFLLHCAKENLPYQLVRVAWQGDMAAAIRRHQHDWFGDPQDLAVICVNDDVAIHAKAAGGPKLDVYGIDGLPEAVGAGIPTYAQPMKEMAQKVIELLAAQQKQSENWHAQSVYCRGKLIGSEKQQAI